MTQAEKQAIIKEFATLEKVQARINSLSVEDLLDSKILNIEPGCNGLVLQPYWGPGLRRPLARGAIIGFSDCIKESNTLEEAQENANRLLKRIGLADTTKYAIMS